MANYVVHGGKRLEGILRIHGAKNAVLPILAASLLSEESVLENCPDLTDVRSALRILEHLGCTTSRRGSELHISTQGCTRWSIPDHLMREMRSSIVFLGAIVARFGKAQLTHPGGCELGPRPIDLHLSSLEKMGVQIQEEGGYIHCVAPEGLQGATITLPFPSVGATENILIAACTAHGTTTLFNAAREPEIQDLADYLNACGASIQLRADGSIQVQGVKRLGRARHRILPDRIAAVTYLCCGAITGGSLTIEDTLPDHYRAVTQVLEEMGCRIYCEPHRIHLTCQGALQAPASVRTSPYPGFPTDALAPLMSLCTVARGTSIFVETIFQSRFKHVPELSRMGAKIRLEGNVAVVEGQESLTGASVCCTDLRGGAGMVVAALAARGRSTIAEISHILRGYEHLDRHLRQLGADIVQEGKDVEQKKDEGYEQEGS